MVAAGSSASETEGKPGRRNREGTEPKAPAGTARGQSAIQEAEEQRTHSQNVQTPRGGPPPQDWGGDPASPHRGWASQRD